MRSLRGRSVGCLVNAAHPENHVNLVILLKTVFRNLVFTGLQDFQDLQDDLQNLRAAS
jgi:hypothetical protein